MSVLIRTGGRFVSVLSVLAALALAPAGASAHHPGWTKAGRGQSYGATALVLDPTTAAALTSLGVTPGVVSPAYSSSGALEFPITTSIPRALVTGTVEHRGGISLTAAGKTVYLTNFWINARSADLSAQVSTSTGLRLGRVTILSLSFAGANFGFSTGYLTFGPVSASLNAAAVGALNTVFGTSLSAPIPLGTATVQYRLRRGFGS